MTLLSIIGTLQCALFFMLIHTALAEQSRMANTTFLVALERDLGKHHHAVAESHVSSLMMIMMTMMMMMI